MTTPNEIEHEQQLIKRGRTAALELIQKAQDRSYFSSTTAGRYTLSAWMPVLIETLETITAKYEEHARTGKPGVTNLRQCCSEVRSYIDLCTIEVIATVTLKRIEDCYTHHAEFVTAQALSSSIGAGVEDEVRVAWWEHKDKEIGDIARKHARGVGMPGSDPHYRRTRSAKAVKRKATQKGIQEPGSWSHSHKCRIGEFMLEVAREAHICQWRKVRVGKKWQTLIDLTEEFETMLLTYERREIENAYERHPLIDVPLDWKLLDELPQFNKSGGYHLPQLRHKQPMCRGYGIHESLFGAKSIELHNTLQHTAWRVDARVLEVAQRLMELNYPVGSFVVPSFDRPRKGDAPAHVVEDKERHAEWKRQRKLLHQNYIDQFKRSIRTRKSMAMAKEYKHKTFYHSWFVDWRGRFYPQQSWLQPQSTDFEKSLLRFRDGCRVTSQSLPVIYAAIGKAYLGSRDSLRTRTKWTADHQQLLNAVAEDPIATIKEWSAADEPWTFLQLCFEWHSVVTLKVEKFWKVPVEVDATASGLQLLSAMRRDPVGMKYVNLLPPESEADDPQDAYMQVLRVAEQMAAKSADHTHLLPYLKYRAVGKPVVMTAIYGATHWSFTQKIKEALLKAGDCPDQPTLNALAKLIYKASRKVFPAAFETLDWLTELGKQAHKQGSDCLRWNTPTGDTVHLVEYECDMTVVQTAFNGTVSFGQWNTGKPDKDEQLKSFTPSFVHSYDAAVLKESFTDWNAPLSVIHDCVLVLPSDMDKALDRLREGFVSVTSGDPLAALADDLGVAAAKFERLDQGEQSLDSVYQSKYMFN